MELKVGMYVRTKYGLMGKIIKTWESKSKEIIGFNVNNERIDLELDTEYKTSYNIIDLIEVGDYVNGEKVNYISVMNNFVGVNELRTIKKDDIKEILTHEQYENNVYKIGEKEQ